VVEVVVVVRLSPFTHTWSLLVSTVLRLSKNSLTLVPLATSSGDFP